MIVYKLFWVYTNDYNMEICRACLTRGNDMTPMDVACLNNYNLLTNLNIHSDEMPLYLCKSCSNAIKFFTEFREKCLSSDATFKNILCMNKTDMMIEDDTACHIKQELKLELELDSDSVLTEYVGFESMDTVIKSDDEDWTPKEIYKNPRKKIQNTTKLKSEPKEKKLKLQKEPRKKKLVFKTKPKDKKLKPEEHCGICTKKFKDTDSLLKHFEFHKFDKFCGLCTEPFIDFTQIMAHRVVHLPDIQKKCHICSKRFIASHYLECHLAKEHKLRGEGGQLLCKHCLAQFDTVRKLTKHSWSVHSNFKYYCDECGKGCRIKSALKSHLKSHSQEKMWQCDICDFSSKYLSGIKEHKVRKHTATRALCKSCGRLFATQELLDKHVCKHIGGILCPKCGKSVNTTSAMARHLRSHSNEFRYKCDRCPKQFKSSSSYRIHCNRHDGIKPYSCEYCSMSFYAPTVLMKHRRVHTGEKPYVCEMCSKAFTGKHNLKVHMKVHGLDLVVKRNAQPVENIFIK